MSCPNCTCTMQALAEGWWWCGRCGSIRHAERLHPTQTQEPILVERVRELHTLMSERVGFSAWDLKAWTEIGLFEAIYPPESRPSA